MGAMDTGLFVIRYYGCLIAELYNWERPHGALLGKSPIDKVVQLSSKVLFWDDVDRMFNPAKERIQEQNYQLDLRARKLKRSV